MKNREDEITCSCGKKHVSAVKELLVGKQVLNRLPETLKKLNTKKVFVLADIHTYKAAGETVVKLLEESGIPHTDYIFQKETVEPDEGGVGSALLHFDNRCDTVISVGSGVLNDIGKIISSIGNRSYIVVATAPSMDGYASSTSSMAMDGVKVSLSSKCPDIIIGDTDILKMAPLPMLKAGLGDMIAKYVSICEWRISHVINGEYYCQEVAELVRKSLKNCMAHAEGLLTREDAAVEAVFHGLVTCGLAMSYAGLSRPASGVEHYFSHIWDMRGLEFGTKVEFHGLQCAVGTVLALKLYEMLKTVTPDREKALEYVQHFDFAQWSRELRAFLGKGADSMIALEKKEGKYDAEKHACRLERILNNWDTILDIIEEELPDREALERLLKKIGIPTDCEAIGVDKKILPMTFKATKDIRYKYVLSHLAWDLGILDELSDSLLS